jgi:hypothetical protein
MEKFIRESRRSRLCAIWALDRSFHIPHEIIRFHILNRLDKRSIYCWSCLKRFTIRISQINPCLYRSECKDKQPVCSIACKGVNEYDQYFMDRLEIPKVVDLLLAYDFLVFLAGKHHKLPAGNFGSTTIAQEEASSLIELREKRVRKQRIFEQHQIKRGRQTYQYEKKKRNARRFLQEITRKNE